MGIVETEGRLTVGMPLESPRTALGPSIYRGRYATTRSEGSRSYGPHAAEVLAGVGFELLPWQADTLDEWLECDSLGRLTRATTGLIVPRRNGKTALILARCLYGIAYLGEHRVTYSAHEQGTAQEAFGALQAILDHPQLARTVRHVYNANGKEAIHFRDGSVFRARTRTAHGGRGLECDLLIIDEAMRAEDQHLAALTPLVAKARASGRGQTIYASSAGDETSEVLKRISDRGRAADGSDGGGAFAYREYCAEDTDDPHDPAVWAKANPSLGTPILSPDFLDSQSGMMRRDEFGREHLGLWGDTADLPMIPPDEWAACASDETVEVDPAAVFLAFDVSLDRTAARLLAVAATLDGRTVVRVLDVWESRFGVDAREVEARIVERYDELQPESIGFDKLGAGDIAARLDDRRYPVKAFQGTAIANACAVLLDDVRNRRVIHDGNPALADDLGRMIPKPFGDGGVVPTRKAVTSGPISGGIALTIGYALVQLAGESDTLVATRG